VRFLVTGLWVLSLSGCVYYNTFFHARKAYDEAEEQRQRAHIEVATGAAAQKYSEAIKKASKVLQNHPKSKYADDAILLIGKAFYHTGEYARAKEKFVELATVFRESPLVGESRYYLGMCEYYLEYPERARTILEEVAGKSNDADLRDRARFMLARIPFEEERYDEALPGLGAYLSGSPDPGRALSADSMIAVSYWELGRYDSARAAYGRLAGRADDIEMKYEALYRFSECAYEAGSFAQGVAEFRRLAGDDKFLVHRPLCEYQVAVGLRFIDSIHEAIEILQRVAKDNPNTEAAARSYFALGEIYEAQGDSLKLAQQYFRDAGKAWTRDAELAAATVKYSTEIAQLLALQGVIKGADSSGFAESHFLLGELYLRQLNEPDSAREQFRLVVDEFAESEYAPLAILNLAEVSRGEGDDSSLSVALWRTLVERYPNGEPAMAARRRLGLPPPTDVAASDVLLAQAAERMLLDLNRPDSALSLYRRLTDEFPTSRYAAQALYAQAWILEHHFAGDDSTVYRAYKFVADQYAATRYGQAARLLLSPAERRGREIAAGMQEATRTDTSYTDTSAFKTTIAQTQDTTVLAPEPLQRGTFDYPVTPPGFTWRENVTVIFLIHINDRGEVEPDLELIGSSGYQEIDEQARQAVLQTRFDPVKLDPFLTVTRRWYKYSLIIPPPTQPGKQFDQYQDPFSTGGQN
jgi:TolA-binding protein